MIEYKINKFLSLKLEGDKTQIYVNGNKFPYDNRTNPLIGLMTSYHVSDILSSNGVKDLHELAHKRELDKMYEQVLRGKCKNLTPQQEFKEYCFGLQAWYDNNYDIRLLNLDLAFPLLNALVDAGDPDAKKVFKIEIVKRFTSGYITMIESILKDRLLEYFTLEEKKQLIYQFFTVIIDTHVVFLFSEEILNYLNPEDQKEIIQQSLNYNQEHYPGMVPLILREKLLKCFSPEEKKQLVQQSFSYIRKNNLNVVPHILTETIMDYLSVEEKKQLIHQIFTVKLENYPNCFPYIFREKLLDYLDSEERAQLMQINYPLIVEFVQKMSRLFYDTIQGILYYFEEIILVHFSPGELKQFIQQYFPVILKDLEKIWNYYPNMFLYFCEKRLFKRLRSDEKIQLIQQYYILILDYVHNNPNKSLYISEIELFHYVYYL